MPRQSPRKPLTPAVIALLAVNIVCFLLGSGDGGRGGFANFALHYWANPDFAPWQHVTSLFLHADLAHLLFNMFALLMFGSVLERQLGAPRFLLLYFAAGIGAGIVQNLVSAWQLGQLQTELIAAGLSREAIDFMIENARVARDMSAELRNTVREAAGLFHTPMVGASGAIYGLLVCFGLLNPNVKLMLLFLPVPIAAKYFIPLILGLDLFSGVTGFSLFGRNIAHFAHLGGALIGLLLTLTFRAQARAASR